MVKCMFIWIYYACLIYSNDLCLVQEAYFEFYGTFKKPREYMSQLLQQNAMLRLRHIYIYYTDKFGDLGFAVNALIYLRTHL